MPEADPPRFEFIRTRYAHLGEDEIAAAERRFARLLDILWDVAVEHQATVDIRFDEIAPAPYDSSPPASSI